jgi:hypothetical protein
MIFLVPVLYLAVFTVLLGIVWSRLDDKSVIAITKSNHMTLVRLRLQSLAKSPLPPFVKGGSAKRGGICHSRSCGPILCGVI